MRMLAPFKGKAFAFEIRRVSPPHRRKYPLWVWCYRRTWDYAEPANRVALRSARGRASFITNWWEALAFWRNATLDWQEADRMTEREGRFCYLPHVGVIGPGRVDFTDETREHRIEELFEMPRLL